MYWLAGYPDEVLTLSIELGQRGSLYDTGRRARRGRVWPDRPVSRILIAWRTVDPEKPVGGE